MKFHLGFVGIPDINVVEGQGLLDARSKVHFVNVLVCTCMIATVVPLPVSNVSRRFA
ncbi:hypothetical protein PLICRDRAFT_35647 [Plicaturopsis crispa FD-325 SS-3]|nr:hypothetical protein PLICRDRAFT_35647 [Plicaturopsis crispa FD-325 SS-3]